MSSRAFPATQQSALRGALSDDPEVRKVSWSRIAGAYYKPVYTYVRLRMRLNEDDAADLTQAFFTRCLERELVNAYDPARGRFRTFLRVCLDRYAIDRRRAATSRAAGGGSSALPFDVDQTEAEILERADHVPEDPDACFEAEWVRHILALAIEALRGHCQTRGKEEHWRVFERYHLEDLDTPPSYATLAEELGSTPITMQNRLSYARRHFRRLTLEILRELTANEEELRLEARTVLGVEP